MARTTLDVDIIAELRLAQAATLRSLLEKEFYVDENMILDAIRQGASFNLIHLATLIKIDIFIHRRSEYQEMVIHRRSEDTLEDSSDSPSIYFASPEDVILTKLQWYDLGSRISERQWLDVIGVIKVQHASLDAEYLQTWATHLGLSELLRKAFQDAGFV